MNKWDFTKAVLNKVNDTAGELTKRAVVKDKSGANENGFSLHMDTVRGFAAGDIVFIDGNTSMPRFTKIISVDIQQKYIYVEGDYSDLNEGAGVIKSAAFDCVDEAVVMYSMYRPQQVKLALSGVNGQTIYSLTEEYNSACQVKSVEYPVGRFPRSFLQAGEYEVYEEDPNQYDIRLMEGIPQGAGFKIRYTKPHEWNTENIPESTVPDGDFYCVVNIAAGYYMLALAAYYGQSTSNTISADSVDYKNKTDSYRRLAKSFMGQAASWLGVDVEQLADGAMEQQPACLTQLAINN